MSVMLAQALGRFYGGLYDSAAVLGSSRRRRTRAPGSVIHSRARGARAPRRCLQVRCIARGQVSRALGQPTVSRDADSIPGASTSKLAGIVAAPPPLLPRSPRLRWLRGHKEGACSRRPQGMRSGSQSSARGVPTGDRRRAIFRLGIREDCRLRHTDSRGYRQVPRSLRARHVRRQRRVLRLGRIRAPAPRWYLLEHAQWINQGSGQEHTGPGRDRAVQHVLRGVHASGDRIVFSGADANWRKGLYLSAGRALSRIVDENTALPSGGGQFVLSDLADASISQDTVVFVLRSSPAGREESTRATLGSSAQSWTAPLRFPKAMGPSRISTPPPWTGRALRSSGRARTASSAHTSPIDRPW